MNDIIAASGVLLAIVVVFQTLWQAAIQSALDTKLSELKKNRTAGTRTVRQALFWRGVPLAFITFLAASIFVPKGGAELGVVARCLSAECDYDPLVAVFLLVETLTVAIAALAAWQCLQLALKWHAACRPDTVLKK